PCVELASNHLGRENGPVSYATLTTGWSVRGSATEPAEIRRRIAWPAQGSAGHHRASETTAADKRYVRYSTEEIPRRDDQRTEQSDRRPHRPLASLGRYTGTGRSFECRRAVCGRVWRPGRRLAGEPGRTGQLGGHRVRTERDRR